MDDFDTSWLENNFEQSLSLWDFTSNPLNECSEPFMDIFTASSVGALDTVKYLVTSQEDLVNAMNRSHWNALMYATYYGYEEVVTFLLLKGAYLHSRTLKGLNVLMIAAKNGYETLVDYYLKLGSVIETRDNKDWTALIYASYLDHLEVAQVLVKYGANVNACARSTGKTPLILAADNGNLAMVELLLQAGATFNFKCVSGKDAYKYAVEGRHDQVLNFFNQWKMKDSGSDFNVPVTDNQNLSDIPKLNKELELQRQSSDLESLLTQFGLSVYIPLFRKHEVDLLVFLTLTDADLKECGVTKLGPRRKMTDLISRWHNNAPLRRGLEAAYCLKLEIEKQELQLQLDVSKKSQRDLESGLVKFKTRLVDLKTRLGECQKRCLIIRDQLAALLNYDTLFSYQKFSEIIGIISVYLEEIFKITDVRVMDARR